MTVSAPSGLRVVGWLLLTTGILLFVFAHPRPAAAHPSITHPDFVEGNGPVRSPLADLAATANPPGTEPEPDLGATDRSFDPRMVRGQGFAQRRTVGGVYEMRIGDRTVQFDHHAGADAALANSSSFDLSPLLVAPPACTSSGRRFVAVYAYPEGAPNQVAQRADTIRSSMWRANGKLLEESLLASGGQRTGLMRVDCNSLGVIEVPSVQIPMRCSAGGDDPGYSPGGGCQPHYAGHVAWAVEKALGSPEGGNSVKYVIFYDKPGTGWSGVGFGWFDGDGDLKSRRNPNREFTTSGILYPEYWDSVTVLHEIGHLMGAVQNSAPRSTGASHCVDGNDVMCYRDGGPRSSQFTDASAQYCPNGKTNAAGFRYDSAAGMPFDCGYNDYFRTRAGDAYLDSHWNVGGGENDLLVFTPGWGGPPGTGTTSGAPDLQLSQEASRRRAGGKRAVTFKLRVRNVGAGASVGRTTVVSRLGRGARFTSAKARSWRCKVRGRIARCVRSAAIKPGVGYPAIRLQATAARGKRVSSRATLHAAGDANPANNTSARATRA